MNRPIARSTEASSNPRPIQFAARASLYKLNCGDAQLPALDGSHRASIRPCWVVGRLRSPLGVMSSLSYGVRGWIGFTCSGSVGGVDEPSSSTLLSFATSAASHLAGYPSIVSCTDEDRLHHPPGWVCLPWRCVCTGRLGSNEGCIWC